MQSEAVTVLLVEDNDDHAELVIRTLGEHYIPNRIYHVNDGQKALDYLFRNNEYSDSTLSPRPNLILLDLRLPKVDGLEVLKALKISPTLRQIPVIVLTTSEAERDVARAYEYYANSYVVKPLGFEQFGQLLDVLGLYWFNWNTRLGLI